MIRESQQHEGEIDALAEVFASIFLFYKIKDITEGNCRPKRDDMASFLIITKLNINLHIAHFIMNLKLVSFLTSSLITKYFMSLLRLTCLKSLFCNEMKNIHISGDCSFLENKFNQARTYNTDVHP